MKRICYSLFVLTPLLVTLSQPMAASNCVIKEDASAYEQYQACPASNFAVYNALLELYQQGKLPEARKIWKQVLPNIKEFEPFQDIQILFGKESGYTKVTRLADLKFQRWSRPFKGVPFNMAPPEKPKLPALPELVKDEFETTSQFKNRVIAAKAQRINNISEIEHKYQGEINMIF